MSDAGPRQDGGKTRRVALTTGADLARVFARDRHDLALVACSRAKLEALVDEIAASGRPWPLVLVFNLIEQGAVIQNAAALDAAGAKPEILINNAGFSLAGETAGLAPAEQLVIVGLNIRVVVDITLRFLPAILRRTRKNPQCRLGRRLLPERPGRGGYYARNL
jgi:short-subunit dehydrogenase